MHAKGKYLVKIIPANQNEQILVRNMKAGIHDLTFVNPCSNKKFAGYE